MPVNRATSSAACFRETPASTSSATAATAASASGSTTRQGPMTSVISPFGRDRALGIRTGQRPERRRQPSRGLECDRRPFGSAQLLPHRVTRRRISRQEADELIALADEPGSDESGLHGRRPGQNRYRHTCVEGSTHDARTRIVDSGHACVGHERDPLPRLQPRQQLSGAHRLVVLVIGEQTSLDPVAPEERVRVSRVLAQHEVRRTQLGEHA